MMKAHYLGHVVFYVKDLQRSLGFYRDLLGFKEVGRIFNGAAAALTSGRTHHELLLIQVGDAPGPPTGRHRGLYHIGIKVGDSLDELRQVKRELDGTGIPIDGMSDHTVSQSLYLKDPDGNEVELYVDADESVWKNNPAAVVSPIKPLYLMILMSFSATEGKSPNVISAADVEGTTIWARDGLGLILKRPLAFRESIKGHRCSAGG
jgi:catechol 2,3-dioxygenase